MSCGAYLHAGRLEVSHRAVRHRVAFGVGEPVGGRRGVVRPWSKASRRRLRTTLHRIDWARHSDAWLVVTLTLPGRDTPLCTDGQVFRRRRRAFLSRLRRRHPGCAYVWKLEFQGRGAAHLAIVYAAPRGVDIGAERAFCARAWWEIVGSGSEAHLRAGTSVTRVHSIRALGSYLVGELVKGKSKEYQHVVPTDYSDVGRWWGTSWRLCEPWSVWEHPAPQAYVVRRALARCVPRERLRARRVVRRALRKRVGRIEVLLGPQSSGLRLGWQLQAMRR